MNKRAALALAAVSTALALAGCGGSPATSPSSSSPPATSSSAPSSSGYGAQAPSSSSSPSHAAELTLTTATIGGQKIIVDGKGMTVYVYTRDNPGTAKSACVGGCASLWPAVTSSEPPALQGVTGKLGSIQTADGKMQVTVNGMPIYYYSKDTGPGKATGQGVAGVWYVLGADGTMIQAKLSGGSDNLGY
ncbi:hypothetical protein [Sinomonas sp. ASV322]|uniref:COG4315 family predicted lipoprotein n=1 Tax=Sinomonas sp. ASV322 TaxID=3041920 RepID=UPI0027DE99DE|nr:hypothetical protein [Sinomonas sp. ASV322]MDQ4502481.1 hypothetical protein [Sinomonas sp. ASV322]